MEQGIERLEQFTILRHSLVLCLFLKDDTGNDQGEYAQDHEGQDAEGRVAAHHHEEEHRQDRSHNRRDGDRLGFEHRTGESAAEAHQEHDYQCEVHAHGTFNTNRATDAECGPYEDEEARRKDTEPHPDLAEHAADLGFGYFFAVAREEAHAYETDGRHSEPEEIPYCAPGFAPEGPDDKGGECYQRTPEDERLAGV